jgi:hypothetical protein
MLDLYCERTSPDFWAEPVNAVTNLAFVLAALMVWRLARRERALDTGMIALIGLIVAISLGSFLFHTLASKLTRWLDILPIFIFQLLYLALYCRRVIRLPMTLTGLLLLFFLLAALGAAQFPAYLNGSLIYAPAWLVIVILGWYHYRSQKSGRRLLLATAGILLISIALRSIDISLCSQFESGTHFLWHVFNALVIYLVMLALILNSGMRKPMSKSRAVLPTPRN